MVSVFVYIIMLTLVKKAHIYRIKNLTEIIRIYIGYIRSVIELNP